MLRREGAILLGCFETVEQPGAFGGDLGRLGRQAFQRAGGIGAPVVELFELALAIGDAGLPAPAFLFHAGDAFT